MNVTASVLGGGERTQMAVAGRFEEPERPRITVELPGVEQKDVKVLVEDGVLTISGEKHVERTDEKTHYSERSYGSFTRAFTLPSDADRNGITASFSKGVLTLQIAKSAHGPDRARQIEVVPN